ncbi:hypothetical protein EBR66_01245 [bacterium]|nr:hypothetical protein [bacterium]
MNRILIFLVMIAPIVAFAGTQGGKFENPLTLEDFREFVAALMKVVVIFGMPLVALALVYSGFLFAKARGNSRDLDTAKKNFKNTIYGAVLIMGAWVFAMALWGTVGQIINGGGGGSATPSPPVRTISA